jgi:hypothetical protein
MQQRGTPLPAELPLLKREMLTRLEHSPFLHVTRSHKLNVPAINTNALRISFLVTTKLHKMLYPPSIPQILESKTQHKHSCDIVYVIPLVSREAEMNA